MATSGYFKVPEMLQITNTLWQALRGGKKNHTQVLKSTKPHYYKTGLCSRPFVPAAFGPGTIGGFSPGSNGQPGQRGTGAFCPGWNHQPGQKALAPLSPSLSPRPSHSAYLFLLFLARERGVLAHFFTTFVKIFDSLVHPSALKVCGLFFSSSIACVAHFML